jgi:hypothetical protein
MTNIVGCITQFVGYFTEMLKGIFGNASAEKVLFYIEQYGEGYATAIAKAFDGTTLHMVQRQLERFERAGLLVSGLKGRTRLYTWNPRYPFLAELRALLAKGLAALPVSERKRYFSDRRRPRRAGKPD